MGIMAYELVRLPPMPASGDAPRNVEVFQGGVVLKVERWRSSSPYVLLERVEVPEGWLVRWGGDVAIVADPEHTWLVSEQGLDVEGAGAGESGEGQE